MRRTIETLLLSAALLAVVALSALLGYRRGARDARAEEVTKIVTETVTKTDTVRTTEFRFITMRTVDTLLVPVLDTVRLRDTVFLALPRTVKRYSDTLFTAEVSGYEPRLDWIEVYKPTRTVTAYGRPPKQRWGVGVQAGYGMTKSGPSPYVGVGVSYDLVRW